MSVYNDIVTVLIVYIIVILDKYMHTHNVCKYIKRNILLFLSVTQTTFLGLYLGNNKLSGQKFNLFDGHIFTFKIVVTLPTLYFTFYEILVKKIPNIIFKKVHDMCFMLKQGTNRIR